MAVPTKRNPFLVFLASGAGRLLRIVVGIVLVLLGLLVVQGTWVWVLGIIGLVPLAAGIFDVCVLGPLFSASVWGRDIRGTR